MGPSPTTVSVNETAFLYCQASYNPKVDLVYVWKFNGYPIDPEKNAHFVQVATKEGNVFIFLLGFFCLFCFEFLLLGFLVCGFFCWGLFFFFFFFFFFWRGVLAVVFFRFTRLTLPTRLHCVSITTNVLFNDALNTFYLRLYGVRYMINDHSDSERGNPLPPHGPLFPISSKGYFMCIIPQTG